MSTGLHFHPFQILAGTLVYGFHAGLVLALFAGILYLPLLGIAIGLWCLKMLADAVAFGRVQHTFGLPVKWSKFPVYETFLMVYQAVIPVLGSIVTVRWKENS
jgi:hypothetical protein